jgi:hypothetical protein
MNLNHAHFLLEFEDIDGEDVKSLGLDELLRIVDAMVEMMAEDTKLYVHEYIETNGRPTSSPQDADLFNRGQTISFSSL